MIQRLPLAQRLGKFTQPGVLQSNPPAHPFWVPEDNPMLLTWDMTLEEYCQTLKDTLHLSLGTSHKHPLAEILREAGSQCLKLPLIYVLGQCWRLLHPDEPEPTIRDDQPPQVWVQWNNVPNPAPGHLEDQEDFYDRLSCLFLLPFALMKKTEDQAEHNRRKEEK